MSFVIAWSLSCLHFAFKTNKHLVLRRCVSLRSLKEKPSCVTFLSLFSRQTHWIEVLLEKDCSGFCSWSTNVSVNLLHWCTKAEKVMWENEMKKVNIPPGSNPYEQCFVYYWNILQSRVQRWCLTGILWSLWGCYSLGIYFWQFIISTHSIIRCFSCFVEEKIRNQIHFKKIVK